MDFKDLDRKLNRLVKGIVDKQLMNAISDKSVQNVKTRTRRGFGVDNNGEKAKKLKALTPATKRIRRSIKKAGRLSSETSPTKSNLTREGDLIDSVKGRTTENEVKISTTGSDNLKKVRDQNKALRIFMNLSKREIQDIITIIKEKVKNDITKLGL